MFRKQKNLKLKIFISSLFQGKKSWNLKRKFKYGFPIALCKKTKNNIFWFQEKKYSELLNQLNYRVNLQNSDFF